MKKTAEVAEGREVSSRELRVESKELRELNVLNSEL